jgi:tetratricopeptide (TPR) repeat protein
MLDPEGYWRCLDEAQDASSEGDVDLAMAWLEKALEHNPVGAEALNGRGEILWDHQRAEEALEDFGRAAEADVRCFAAQLNRIEILIEEFGEHETALEYADELLASSLEGAIEAEVYYLKAKALFYLDDLEGALFLLRRALRVLGEVGIYRGFEGQILFELGQFQAARRSLERALRLEPECAHSSYHMGLVLEHLGEPDEAERLFHKAAHIAPDTYPVPIRIEDEEFETASDDALKGLPSEIRDYVSHCPIIIEDLPSPDLVREENLSPMVLGLFLGVPLTEAGANPHVAPEPRAYTDRMLLFKRNLEKIASNRAELIKQIRITVWHEVGHYLGKDEAELEELGLG